MRLSTNRNKYAEGGFRSRLRPKIHAVRDAIGGLAQASLHEIDHDAHVSAICSAYEQLASGGEGALNADTSEQFHVGTTKILHWIVPSLFIMVDSNVAKAFHTHHQVGYKRSTQPGYTSMKYLACLRHAQNEIRTFGFERFKRIEPATAMARLFDKAAWSPACRR